MSRAMYFELTAILQTDLGVVLEKLLQSAVRIQVNQFGAKSEVNEHGMPASILPGRDHQFCASLPFGNQLGDNAWRVLQDDQRE